MPSCALIPPTLDCSDLQIGEELAVVIGEPVYADEDCGAAFGVLPGAEIRLHVEAYGDWGGCNSMIGPTFVPGQDITYDAEQSMYRSGGVPLLSASLVRQDDCEGSLIISLLHPEAASPDSPDTFTQIGLSFIPRVGSQCGGSCSSEYNVQVTRM
jgi:hypothetical protein